MKQLSSTRNCALAVIARSEATWQSMLVYFSHGFPCNGPGALGRSQLFFDSSPTHTPPPGFWGQSPNSPSLRLAQRVRRFAPQRNWCLTPITRRGASFGRVLKRCSALRWDSWIGAVLPAIVSFPAAFLVHQIPVENNWGLTPINPQLVGTQYLTHIEPEGIRSISTRIPSGYFFALNTRPNRAVGSPFPPGGAGRGRGGMSGAKNGKNTNLSVTPMPFDGTAVGASLFAGAHV